MATDCICIKAEELGAHTADISNLKKWQESQNGALIRLTDDMKALRNWIIGLLGSSLLSAALLIANLMKK